MGDFLFLLVASSWLFIYRFIIFFEEKKGYNWVCKLTGHLIALLVVSSDCLDRYMLLQVVGQVDLIESCPSACVLKVL